MDHKWPKWDTYKAPGSPQIHRRESHALGPGSRERAEKGPYREPPPARWRRAGLGLGEITVWPGPVTSPGNILAHRIVTIS